MDESKQEYAKLKEELEVTKQQVLSLRSSATHSSSPNERKQNRHHLKLPGPESHVSIVIVGASGDLAKKKTFPSLFSLYCLNLLSENFTIFGFSRSTMTNEEFRKHASKNFKGFEEKRDKFLSNFFYHSGQYGSTVDFSKLCESLEKHAHNSSKHHHRMFYLAVPPSVFGEVAKVIKSSASSKNGWTRLIVEKPFGKDSESYATLSQELAESFEENEIYRIDHYLGKEMVQNLMIMRFANVVWEPIWHRHYVSSVLITFKENIGTEGRGGYFDEYGIIRDVMQNHLLQILSLIAMEPPVSMNADDVRDEKVKVLRACRPIIRRELVVGQYVRDEEGKNASYLDDPQVSKDSITPTFAVAIIHIDNQRWSGVPFILKCGKGLEDRKAEIRIQFRPNATNVYQTTPRNELVMRVQPDEAVYMKFNGKVPGLSEDIIQTELDLTYKSRFEARLPDAYERLLYDVLRGDHNLFVRSDELDAAWNIFTPILHQLEREKVKPIPYPFGSRGPKESDDLIQSTGFERSTSYKWPGNKS